MFLLGFDLPVWTVLIPAALALLYWYGTGTYNTFDRLGIPCAKPPLPFIGNMHTAFSDSIINKDRVHREQFGRIYGDFQGRTPVLIISDAEFIKEITIKQSTKFLNRRDFGLADSSDFVQYAITLIKNEHWKHLRAAITPTFTSGKLKKMYKAITDSAVDLSSHLQSSDGEPSVIKDYTSGFTMDVIAKTAFGIQLDSQHRTDHPFIEHGKPFFGIPRKNAGLYGKIKPLLNVLLILLFPTWAQKLFIKLSNFRLIDPESDEYFQNCINKVLKQRQMASTANEDQTQDDFIHMCMEKRVDLSTVSKESVRVTDGRVWTTEGLVDKEIMASAMIFLTAGFETTATALQFLLYNLALHPDVQQKLFDEVSGLALSPSENPSYEQVNKLEYLDWCICESLRLYPPAIRFDRVCSETTEVNGYTIPAGMIVNISVAATHYDPEYWPEPTVYRPERFSAEQKSDLHQYTFIPFGLGSRSCVAMRLALLEMKAAACRILRDFEFRRSETTPDPADMEFAVGNFFLVTKSPLKLSAIRRDTIHE